jgi:hypothetical protein
VVAPLGREAIAGLLHGIVRQRRRSGSPAGDEESPAAYHPHRRRRGFDHHNSIFETKIQRHSRLEAGGPP